MEMEMKKLRSGSDDTDLPKMSKKTRMKVKRIWKIISFVINWITVGLYIWDCINSLLSYRYWIKKPYSEDFKQYLIAWFVFSIIGSVLALLLIYNTLIISILFFKENKKLRALSHQYSAFIVYYIYEIPKSVIFLTMMIKYSIIVDDPKNLTAKMRATSTPFYLGHLLHHHIYFKIIFEAVTMLGFFVLGIIEFVHIVKEDRQKVFLVFNCIAAVFHLCVLIGSTVMKILIEMKN